MHIVCACMWRSGGLGSAQTHGSEFNQRVRRAFVRVNYYQIRVSSASSSSSRNRKEEKFPHFFLVLAALVCVCVSERSRLNVDDINDLMCDGTHQLFVFYFYLISFFLLHRFSFLYCQCHSFELQKWIPTQNNILAWKNLFVYVFGTKVRAK